jgi:hypothetical protein
LLVTFIDQRPDIIIIERFDWVNTNTHIKSLLEVIFIFAGSIIDVFTFYIFMMSSERICEHVMDNKSSVTYK